MTENQQIKSNQSVCSKNKLAVIALTSNGIKLSQRLQTDLAGIDLYLPVKLKSELKLGDEKIKVIYFKSLRKLIGKIFKSYQGLVFIMALGIVVRIIASQLADKRTDPAVVTIDESACNVISTLSGHLGGANQLTLKLANLLNANPVITTATDCQGRKAFEILARDLNLTIKPAANLTAANAALVNKKPLKLFSDQRLSTRLADYLLAQNLPPVEVQNKVAIKQKLELADQSAYFAVIISNQILKLNACQLQLIPHNIIVGIGCRQGIKSAEIDAAVKTVFAELNLSILSIKKLASIEIKKTETGLLNYAVKHDFSLDFIALSKIKEKISELQIKKSAFVEKIIGVGAAASPAAILTANSTGKLLLDKAVIGKITISVVEEEINYEAEPSCNRW